MSLIIAIATKALNHCYDYIKVETWGMIFRTVSLSKRKLVGLIIVGSIVAIFAEPVLRDLPYRLGYTTPSADYRQLLNFLETKQWKAADLETMQIMLQVTHREKQGFLSARDLETFPCADLKMLNQLWLQNSNSRFGFSVQKQVFERIQTELKKQNTVKENNPTSKSPSQVADRQSAIPPERNLVNEFSKRVGWSNTTEICNVPGTGISLHPYPENCKGSIQVNDNTPSGHLPSWGVKIPEPYTNHSYYSVSHLAKRLKSCSL